MGEDEDFVIDQGRDRSSIRAGSKRRRRRSARTKTLSLIKAAIEVVRTGSKKRRRRNARTKTS